MRGGRLTAPGRLTNYELADLRAEGELAIRQRGHRALWSSLADPFHPRSQAEWRDYVRVEGGEGGGIEETEG